MQQQKPSAKPFFALLLVLSAAGALAVTNDTAQGKVLFENHCVACHVKNFGGDGSGVFTRPKRIVNSMSELNDRIAFCESQAKAGLSAEDESKIAAFLNEKFYHFK